MPEAKEFSESAVEPVVPVAVVVPPKGVKETKELLDLLLECGNIVKLALADGKVTVADAALLFNLLPRLGPAVEGIDQLPAELKDLSVEEAGELVAHVMTRLAVDDRKARDVIEASLKIGVGVLGLVKAIVQK